MGHWQLSFESLRRKVFCCQKKCETSLNVNRFCIALLSALMQTHCALVADGLIVAFYSAFLNSHRSGVLTALFGCYMAGAT